MNYWFYINLTTFLLAILFFLWGLPKTSVIILASLLGMIGLLFILFNWNMHAIFSKIRTTKNRNDRIKIAKHARKIMPFHMIIGIFGLILISGHALLIFLNYQVFINSKVLTGVFAFIGLIVVSVSGYLRRVKASRLRRLIHLYSSFILFVLIVFHLLI